MQVRGLGIHKPLGGKALPERISDERCLELTIKLKQRTITREEKEEIALGFIRYGISIASRYARHHPNKANDYVSCAMFAIWKLIVESPDMLSEVDETDLGSWMTKKIYSNVNKQCQEFTELDRIIMRSARTMRYRKQHGMEELPPIKIADLSMVEYGANHSFISGAGEEASPRRKLVEPICRKTPSYNRERLNEIEEMLEKIVRDQVDKTIISMRIEGYRDAEIAKALGKSTAYINNKRAELENRFERLERK